MENEAIRKIVKEFSKAKTINYADIPGIDLYVDQVTTFIDKNLSDFKRGKEDKLLTKTMINNYTKDKVLPPPEKKKYSKEHMLLLVLIYHLKSVLSLSDIQLLINRTTESGRIIEAYKSFETMYQEMMNGLENDVMKKYDSVLEGNSDNDVLFVILSLVIEANIKKHLAERLIDNCLKKR